jgi:hypothetical protein
MTGSPYFFVLLSSLAMGQQAGSASPLQDSPSIQVLEGDGAINSIRLHRGHEPKVRIADQEGRPISGAAVTFVLPATGASASFGDRGLSVTVMSDERGEAVGRGLRPNGVAGQFRIRVTTSWHDSPAVATLVQTNAEPVIRASHTKTIALIVLIAGAAGGGAAAALGGKSGASGQTATTSVQTPPGTIISGNPSLGPPH